MASHRFNLELNPFRPIRDEVAALLACNSGILSAAVMSIIMIANIALLAVEYFQTPNGELAFPVVMAFLAAICLLSSIASAVLIFLNQSARASIFILSIASLVVGVRLLTIPPALGYAGIKGVPFLTIGAGTEIFALTLAITGVRGSLWIQQSRRKSAYRWSKSASSLNNVSAKSPTFAASLLVSALALLISIATFMLTFLWKPSGLLLTANFSPQWYQRRQDGAQDFAIEGRLLYVNIGHRPAIIEHVQLSRRFLTQPNGNCEDGVRYVEVIATRKDLQEEELTPTLPATIKPGELLSMDYDFDVFTRSGIYSLDGPMRQGEYVSVELARVLKPWVLCLETSYYSATGRELRHLYQVRKGIGPIASGWQLPVDSPVMRLLPPRLEPLDFHLREPR